MELDCEKCKETIANCKCPDIDERLKECANPGFAMKWCRQCDKHYKRCKCSNPDFYIIGGPAGFAEKHQHLVNNVNPIRT